MWSGGLVLRRISLVFVASSNLSIGSRGYCGAIDGTVIPMKKPSREQAGGDSDCYLNYKGHTASLLLAVVDCDLCFPYIS